MQFKSPFSNKVKTQMSRPALQDQIFQCNVNNYSEDVKAQIAKIKLELTKLNDTIYNLSFIKDAILKDDREKYRKIINRLKFLRSTLQQKVISLLKQ